MPTTLNILPNITFPVTSRQCNGLMDGVQALNLAEAGVDPRTQKALDILLHVVELYADTNGQIDYMGQEGHKRLFQDAVSFVPEQVVTKHGDLRAAHLAIDFNNAQAKLKKAGLPLLTGNRDDLINQCRDILTLPLRSEERMGLLLSYLAKKTF